MLSDSVITIYTDGSCLGNPGPGGWAAVVDDGTSRHKLSGGSSETTNNRMELTGVISALEFLDSPRSVIIHSDSKYVVDAINKGWLENWKRTGWHLASGGEVKNPDLWQRLDKLLGVHDCTFKWVKGHAGNQLNEICDALANQRAADFESGLLSDETVVFVSGVALDRLSNPRFVPEPKPEPELDAGPALEVGPKLVDGGAGYSVDEVMSALDLLIAGLNQRKFDGLERPCGARDFCEFCENADTRQYPCALAYLEATKRKEADAG